MILENRVKLYYFISWENTVKGPMTFKEAIKLQSTFAIPGIIARKVINEEGKEVI